VPFGHAQYTENQKKTPTIYHQNNPTNDENRSKVSKRKSFEIVLRRWSLYA